MNNKKWATRRCSVLMRLYKVRLFFCKPPSKLPLAGWCLIPFYLEQAFNSILSLVPIFWLNQTCILQCHAVPWQWHPTVTHSSKRLFLFFQRREGNHMSMSNSCPILLNIHFFQQRKGSYMSMNDSSQFYKDILTYGNKGKP